MPNPKKGETMKVEVEENKWKYFIKVDGVTVAYIDKKSKSLVVDPRTCGEQGITHISVLTPSTFLT